MFAAMMLIISALSFEAKVTKLVEAYPAFDGRVVQVCYDHECVTVDRTVNPLSDIQPEASPSFASEDTVTDVIDAILERVSTWPGNVQVDYVETSISSDGSQHIFEVHIALSKPSGPAD